MRGLLRIAGSITTGTVMLQAGTAICLIAVSFFRPTDAAVEFSQTFALAQLIGLSVTFGLTSAVIAERDPDKACNLSGFMAIVSILASIIIVLPVLLILYGPTVIGVVIFALGLALCEALRSNAIGAARMNTVASNFAGLSIVIIALGFFEVMALPTSMSFGLAGLALGLLWFLQGHANLTLASAHWSLLRLSARQYWRYFVFRSATISLDFLTSRGVILLMGSLPSSYVVFFFLSQRILIAPVQQLTYALSLSLLRQASDETAEDTRLTIIWVWRRISLVGMICLPITAAGLALATRLELSIIFERLEATTLLYLLLYTFYLAYVTWLGRLFDLRSAQATAFVVEFLGKAVIISILLIGAYQAPLIWFAPTFFICQVMFGIVWLVALFNRMGWGYGLILHGQVIPIVMISGVSVIFFEVLLFN